MDRRKENFSQVLSRPRLVEMRARVACYAFSLLFLWSSCGLGEELGCTPARKLTCPNGFAQCKMPFAPERNGFSCCNFEGEIVSGDLVKKERRKDGRFLDLRSKYFDGASFCSAKLSDVDFSGSNLEDAIFENIDGCNPSSSNSQRVNVIFGVKDYSRRPAELVGSSFDRARLCDFDFPWADLSEASMNDAYVYRANFYKAKLQDAEAQRAEFVQCKWEHTDLSGAVLDGSRFEPGHCKACKLNYASLDRTKFGDHADLINSILYDADLDCVDAKKLRAKMLDGAAFRGARIKGAQFQNSYMSQVKLQGACLIGGNLRQAQLVGANLEGSYLQNVYLWKANFSGAILSGAQLHGATLDDSNITQEQVDQACGDETTSLPDGIYMPASWPCGGEVERNRKECPPIDYSRPDCND